MENQEPSKDGFAVYIGRLRQFRLPLVIAFYLLSVPLSYWCAFYIRHEPIILYPLIILFFARLLTYALFRVQFSSWQFTSLHDLADIVKAGVLGSLVFLSLIVLSGKMNAFPLSIIPMEGVISICTMSGIRLIFRYYYEVSLQTILHKINKRVLIVGAGAGGILALQEMRNNRKLGIMPIGFIDDNPYIKGTKRRGIAVLGNTEELSYLVSQNAIDEVIVAIPSAAHKDIIRIVGICRSVAVPVRVIPSVGKFIQDESYTGRLKEVVTDDLLGRKVIRFSRESDRLGIDAEIKDRCVFVSGAGGSIGSELCRQTALYKPRLLILYERHETSLAEIEIDMRKYFPNQQILPILGDILDTQKVDKILRSHAVNLIYHAAAYKHVPVMEREPLEAVRNNIFGTFRLAELAVKHHVKKFIMISTDKAVKPSSVMGATKRVAELIVQSLNEMGISDEESSRFISVRFGNVIGSNGSMIPIFKKQIAEGGPVTVTHREMTRYFMAISEAVALVMMSGSIGRGGEIFLLNMGAPIKILDVAEALIRRSGLIPAKDIDIVFSGIRPGEKLHEELYWSGEGVVPTENESITMLKPEKIDYTQWLDRVNMLELEIEASNIANVMRRLQMLVNDFTPHVDVGVYGTHKVYQGDSPNRTVTP